MIFEPIIAVLLSIPVNVLTGYEVNDERPAVYHTKTSLAKRKGLNKKRQKSKRKILSQRVDHHTWGVDPRTKTDDSSLT